MPIDKGDWVRRRGEAAGSSGFVTEVKAYNACVRWVGAGRGEWVAKRQIRSANAPRLLLLEGSLDEALHSTRSESRALGNWCDANGIKLAHKNIHRLEDLEVIARSIGKHEPPFVHLSCHGKIDDHDKAFITFAPRPTPGGRFYLGHEATQRAFRAFEGRSLLLSACSVGSRPQEMNLFREGSRLAHVAAFCREISDDEAILFDLAVYHAAINLGLTFGAAVERARQTVGVLEISGSQGQQLVRVF